MLLAARRWAWLLALALVLAARPAHACKCTDDLPRLLVRPLWPPTSGLMLSSESIDIDCSAGERCRWRSIHIYTRASPGEPARVPLVLPFWSLEIRFGGQPVPRLDREAEELAEAAVNEQRDGFESGGQHFWLEDDGTQTTVELVIEGDISPNGGGSPDPPWYFPGCCHYTALDVRHPFVPTYSTHARFEWSDPDADTVAPDAETHVRVRPLPNTELRVDQRRAPIGHVDVYEFDAPSQSGVGVSMIRERRLKGGPFIAFGGALLDANPARGRIGWEHTHPVPFLFYSAALETDFQRELTAVPAIEISHGRGSLWWFIPCAGLGFGVPVQILPDPRPGLRGQFSLSWRVFSILTTFDWHMPLRSTDAGVERPTLLKLAILGQFSF